MNSKTLATKTFPPQGSLNPLGIEYGDSIVYSGNGVEVGIYACGFYTLNEGELGHVVDGNICCNMEQVVRISKKKALQSL